MRRSSFEAESRLVGEDFGDLILREGGKSAGLHLLEKGIIYLKDRGKLEVSKPIGTLPWYSVPTSITLELESHFEEILKNDDAFNVLISKSTLLNEVERRILQSAGNRFKAAKNQSFGCTPAYAPKFHIRSSTTLEDFKDDGYYGTFKTVGETPLFCYSYENSIREVIIDFFLKKSSRRFKIDKKERLGLVIMPTVGEIDDKDVIVYSGYPEEKESPVLVETWVRNNFEGKSPLELVRCKSPIMVERVPMFIKQYNLGVRPLTKEELQTIFVLTKAFEEELNYKVNLELTVTSEGIIPYQIRPVPELPKDREVTSLSHVPSDMQVIAQTPFVKGSFRKSAKLVKAHYKNHYQGHKFKEPVIIRHTDDFKAQRFYFNDNNCIAILNPEEGAALTHDSSFFPAYGTERDRYCFIGLPFNGFRSKLEKILVTREEKVHGGLGKFSYTPFDLTIESDGRSGRVLVKTSDAHYFT